MLVSAPFLWVLQTEGHFIENRGESREIYRFMDGTGLTSPKRKSLRRFRFDTARSNLQASHPVKAMEGNSVARETASLLGVGEEPEAPSKSPTSGNGSTMARKTKRMISSPHENDVLMGRGGKNNQHSGNEKLRELARQRCEEYRLAPKRGKSEISKELVRRMRTLDPPARFLRKDKNSCKWEDVGDDIAREKASQVLRDAVGEKNGPMAKSRQKINSGDRSPDNESASGNLSDDTVEVDHVSKSSSGRTSPRSRSHPDNEFAEVEPIPLRPLSSSHRDGLPTVTPASTESTARKRQRVRRDTHPTYASDPYSLHGNSYGQMTRQEMVLSPTVPRGLYPYQGPAGTFSLEASQHPLLRSHRTPASAAIPGPYSTISGGRNEPWLADVNPQYVVSRSSAALPPAPAEFDPYNEDILSVYSDQKDGSIADLSYSRRDSL